MSRLALLGLMVVIVGCSKSGGEPPRAEVSGTVTVKGRPLTGGVIAFISDTGFQQSATIDEQGHYKILAAVGSNKIRVDNRVLRTDKDKAAAPANQNPAGPSLKNPKMQKGQSPRLKSAPEATDVVNGTYVPIKDSYASFETSGLTYSVSEGPQTKDVEVQ